MSLETLAMPHSETRQQLSTHPPRPLCPQPPKCPRGSTRLRAPACRHPWGSASAAGSQSPSSAPGGLWFPCLGGPAARWGGCGVRRDGTRQDGMG